MGPYLCLPIDVVRLYNPQVTQDDIKGVPSNQAEASAQIIGNDDYQQILSQIEAAESELSDRHNRPYKLEYARKETPNDYLQISNNRAFPQLWVELPHNNIVSIDTIEIRTGLKNDDWETLDTNDYVLDHEDGTLTIHQFRWFSDLYDHPGKAVRVSYTHGALGRKESQGGQTKVTESTGTGTGTWNLEDGGHLPEFPQTFQIDGEYVRGEVSGDTLEVTERGVHGTTASDHSSGEYVHYSPMTVRNGVAAKVAMWLANSSIKLDEVAGESMSPQDRMEQWNQQWENLTGSGSWHSV